MTYAAHISMRSKSQHHRHPTRLTGSRIFFFNFVKIYMNEKPSRCRETATNSLDCYVNVLIAAIYVFFFLNELGFGRNLTGLNTLVIPS